MTLICQNCGKPFESKRKSMKYCCHSCANKAAADERSARIDRAEKKIVWSSGGGIQSTAIAVLIYRGKLPKPDFAFMADAGYESKRTIDYIHRIVQPKLKEVGVNFEIVSASQYVDVNLFDINGFCNIPAFRKNVDGSVSRLDTRCNGVWKQIVMRKWLREHGVVSCINWVGISTDESHRAGKSTGLKWITNSYPLIDLGLSRKDCVQLIKQAGWEMPIRTSCIMCPLRTKYEWLRLKMDCPEDFERAKQIEQEIWKIDRNVYLNYECRPLAEYVEGE